ncbi:MAG: hypothetical protein ACLFN0_00305, partial [Thermovirgaceae bacterium]
MPPGFFPGGPVFGPWIARRKTEPPPKQDRDEHARDKDKREKPEKKTGARGGAREDLRVRTDELELLGLTKKIIYSERIFARVPFAFFALAAAASGILAASIEPSDPQ